jgi:RNA polymerase sigma factor (sigma-70 family)
MQPTDDSALLRQYAENNSDEAFAALVTRHINLVYSVALRQVGNPHHAEEITQAVFIILAKKAVQLRHDKALSSWLFQATRLTANNFVRSEARRRRREEEAHMQSVVDESGSEVWPRIAPLLDTAVANLREKDRQVIVLRFYEGRNLREVGLALGASEDAAEKRVSRALEKLRKFFTKKGVSSTTAIIAGAISANSVQAAPVALAKSVMVVAIAKGAAASGSTLTLIKGALKLMAWTKAKTAIVIGAGLILAAGTTTVLLKTVHPAQPTAYWSRVAGLLKPFVAEKEAQADAAARAEGTTMLPEYKVLFAAAAKGDWPTVDRNFTALKKRASQSNHPGPSDERLTGTQWQAALETYGAFEAFDHGDDKYCVAFGRDIIDSIPPGSIYFGGTGWGRFLVTALCKSQVNADPFFTLTQNAPANGGYLTYLRSMYGDKIYIPTDADAQQCSEEYLADAQRRSQQNKLKPGENFKIADGKPQVTGSVAEMEVYSLLAKVIFDKNPSHEFYLEESYPFDWMYPLLEPHGLIMKVNRQPLSELSDDIVSQDQDYWTKYVTPMIGGWLNEGTPVSDIAAFAEKVHLRHDLGGFNGDPRFVQNDNAGNESSKLRSSIAGIYMWRVDHAADKAEKNRMARAADFAFRQAWALCPNAPEALFRYINFLLKQKRNPDALLVASTGLKLAPDNVQMKTLVSQLQQMRGAK